MWLPAPKRSFLALFAGPQTPQPGGSILSWSLGQLPGNFLSQMHGTHWPKHLPPTANRRLGCSSGRQPGSCPSLSAAFFSLRSFSPLSSLPTPTSPGAGARPQQALSIPVSRTLSQPPERALHWACSNENSSVHVRRESRDLSGRKMIEFFCVCLLKLGKITSRL